MDPFRLCLALGPVAIYLLLLGAINLRRRPFLISGVRDAALLALAVSGLVIVGPIEMFFPYEAALKYGPPVWFLLLALYVLCVVLVLLLLRPRLVIYNISANRLRPILAELVARLDPEARWAGDSLALPGLGVQLYVESFAVFDSVSLVSAGGSQSGQGWRRLEAALGGALAPVEVGRNLGGLSLIIAGLLIIAFIALVAAQNPQAVVQTLVDITQTLRKITGL